VDVGAGVVSTEDTAVSEAEAAVVSDVTAAFLSQPTNADIRATDISMPQRFPNRDLLNSSLPSGISYLRARHIPARGSWHGQKGPILI
jgi:hypothetical protein